MRYYLPKVEVKDHNVKIDGRNFFHQPMNDDIKTYENIFKNTAGQGDDYITGYLSDYHFFKKKKFKLIAIDLSKQEVLDAIQQINFTRSLDRAAGAFMFSILEEYVFHSRRSKRNYFGLFTKNCKSIVNNLIH